MKPYLLLGLPLLNLQAHALPQGFVYLQQIAPQVVEDLRYVTADNFMGRPVPGYLANRCILTLPAAQQLAKAEKKPWRWDILLKFMTVIAHKKQLTLFIYGVKKPATKK
ncbi:hypothetical protein Lbru_2859 [Legionella brunensis]|uniref:Uncharacterized protein n=1 Tax=Legionella brunensis TaxID=29422 RepID=A0A0W0S009_9GAMM|nr:M15 family metallopeptidase [Legionella brunensis]KTC76752.1 hypothetical protein Lbru_2859 [Legionella brunensis]